MTEINKKFNCDKCLLIASCNKYVDVFTYTRDISNIYGYTNTPLKISIECKEYRLNPDTRANN